MKSTTKDFFREINSNKGRFLSILFIVLLGTAFLSGIRSSEPDMRQTGDTYADDSELMDIKALCTYGVTEEDVKAVKELPGVEDAIGEYGMDFVTNYEGDQKVIHVMGINDSMNHLEVTEGRLPDKVGECVADADGPYKVGDKIKLASGDDSDIEESLKEDELSVVGLASSPFYISFQRGSSSIGAGKVHYFVAVPDETFALEVYTEIYVKVEGAKELISFTDEYNDRVEEVKKDIEDLLSERAVIRKQEIIDEANEALDEAKQAYEEGKAEAAAQLADAAEQIAKAKAQLAAGRQQIESARAQLITSRNELEAGQLELNNRKQQYETAASEVAAGRAAYEEGLAQYEAGKSQAVAELEAKRNELLANKEQIDEARVQAAQLKLIIEALSAIPDPTEEQQAKLMEYQAAYDQLQASIDSYDQGLIALDQAEEEMNRKFAETEAELARTDEVLTAAEAQLQGVPEQLAAGQNEINSGYSQIAAAELTIAGKAAELAAGESELIKAEEEYKEGVLESETSLLEAKDKIDKAEEEISEIEDPKWYVYDRSVLPEFMGYGENSDRIGAIGKVFPVLFFLIAALISLTSMTRMVEEQRTQIGTMMALGYTTVEIAGKYMGYALCATAIGSVIGVLIGEKILPFIIIYAYGIIYPHINRINLDYRWSYGIIAAFAGVASTLAATWFATDKALRSTPATLMRPPSPKNGRKLILERIGFIWRRLSFSWKSTIRNIVRYKKRFFMTIIGIGGCMGLMICGFGIKDSCFEIIDFQYEDIQFYDGTIVLKDNVSAERLAELKETLSGTDKVKSATNVRFMGYTLKKGKKSIDAYQMVFSEGTDLSEYVDFHDRVTRKEYKLTDEGVIVSEKTAKLLDVEVGDTIEIEDVSEGNKEVVIADIAENYLGHYMYMTPKYYEKVYGEKPYYNSLLFIADEGATDGQIENVGMEMVKEDEVLAVSFSKDIASQMGDILKSLNLVIIVLIVSAGMLAFVVLYNLNLVNIQERRRELATLKVLGFFDGEVATYVFRENVILTFVGCGVGVAIGNLLHRFIITTVEVEGAMFGRVVSGRSYLYSFLITILFSLMINGVMYFTLKKIDMIDSLKSVE